MTISVVRDDVSTMENARTVPTFASTIVKKVNSLENASASMEKIVDSYGSGTRRKHLCHVNRS